jgi:transposase InsO family protein
VEATEPRCYGLSAQVIDELVSQQVLRALEPAALQFSLQTQANVKLDRQRLVKHWQQRRKRVRYDVELAERRYQAVYPENRLVASSLEKKWDQTLRYERQFEEDYDRFLHAIPDVWGVTLHGMNSFID